MWESFHDSFFEYNYRHIDILLKDKVKNDNQYIVWKASHCTKIKKIIKKICKIYNANDNITIVLPIFYSTDNVYTGHWVGLVIKKENNNIQAIYVDSMDRSMDYILNVEDSIIKILKDNNVKIIQMCLIEQHDNLSDCGPWTVLNLDSLARTGKLPVGIDETSIMHQRKYLINLLRTESRIENQLDRSTKIEISKTSIREVVGQNEIKDKDQDIKRLEEMVNIIRSFLNGTSDIKTTLKTIGELCGDISPIDLKKLKCNNIRNKHGYIQRDIDKKTINRKGFHFDKLYQLKIILDHEEETSPISNDDLTILGNTLNRLKEKLIFILRKEKQFIHQQDIVNQVEHVSTNNDEFPAEFIEICNKYYEQLILQRIHCELTTFNNFIYEDKVDRYAVAKMGILIGDLVKELTDCYYPPNDDLCSALKNFYFIRSKLIYMYTKIKYESTKKWELFNKQVIELLNNLLNCIRRDPEVEMSWSFLCDCSNAKLLRERTEGILKYLKDNTKAREESQNRRKSLKKNDANLRYNLDKIILKASEIITQTEFNKKQKSIQQRLLKLNGNYQKELNKLNVNDRKSFPPQLNIDHKYYINEHSRLHFPVKPSENDESEKMKLTTLQNRFKQRISDIDEEIDNLMKIESDTNIDPLKKKYIIEYLVIVITQYVRDAGEIIQDYPTSQDIILNSQTSESLAIADDLPNDIISKLDKKLSKYILIDSITDRDSVGYLFTFPEFETNSITSITLCNVGVSFFKLGLHQQAIQYLQRASIHIMECEDKITIRNQSDMNTQMESVYQSNNLHLPSIRKDRYWFFIKRTLANILHSANRDGDALGVFEEINQRIKFDIKSLANSEIKTELIDCLVDFAFFLTDIDKIQDAIKIFEQIIDITEDISIKIKYLEALYRNCEFEKANDFLNRIIENCADDITKCKILSSFISICVCHGNVEKGIRDAQDCIGRMDTIGDNAIEIINNEAILGKLKIIYAKLKSVENDVLIFEDEFKNLYNNMQWKFQNNPTIALIYMQFSWIYTRSILSKFDKENYKKAKHYLTLAKSKVTETGKSLLNINQKLRTIAHYISLACNKHSEINSETSESHIHYLHEAKDIEVQFKIISVRTFKNLSVQYKHLANEIHTSSIDANTKALSLYQKSLLFSLLASKELEKRCGNEKYQIMDHSWIELLKECSSNYYQIAAINHDMNFMKKAYTCYRTLTKYSFPVNDNIELDNFLLKCETEISLFIEFLRGFLFNTDDIIMNKTNSRMVEFCNNTFKTNLQFENDILIRRDVELIQKTLDDFDYFLRTF